MKGPVCGLPGLLANMDATQHRTILAHDTLGHNANIKACVSNAFNAMVGDLRVLRGSVLALLSQFPHAALFLPWLDPTLRDFWVFVFFCGALERRKEEGRKVFVSN